LRDIYVVSKVSAKQSREAGGRGHTSSCAKSFGRCGGCRKVPTMSQALP